MLMEPKITFGQAIDKIVEALSSLDKKQQQTAIVTVCSVLEIRAPSGYAEERIHAGNGSAAADPDQRRVEPAGSFIAAADPPIDIRALRTAKQPDSAVQMAAIVAFYLQELAPEGERKQTVVAADLDRLFKQAQFRLPVKLDMVLPNAKAAGYFEAVARGEYRLTRVGYNLVTHGMPKSKADA